MLVLYSILISVASAIIRLAALFNAKAKLFVEGRKGLFTDLRRKFANNTSPVVWVHCASLGEFEQGRPLIEAFKKEMPEVKVLLTFYSPSGYEVRKNYALADWVYYLPMDSKHNARQFVEITKPRLAIFVKYEFWIHFINELSKRSVPLISVASIFRSEQFYFKSYGAFYLKALQKVSWFFVQNFSSLDLLKRHGITAASVAGDTRFDRVFEIVKKAEEVPLAKRFKGDEKVIVVGSAWPEDLEVLAPFINEQGNFLKFIIAPHEVTETSLATLERQLQRPTIRYSQAEGRELKDYCVLIIDNVGMLSKLYRYGEFAFIGGAYGKGLHNILEAACYGIPVFFGNKNFEKFQEAKDLINRGGAFEVGSYDDFRAKYEMVTIPGNFMLACEVTRSYVEENLGATDKIMKYCRTHLKQ